MPDTELLSVRRGESDEVEKSIAQWDLFAIVAQLPFTALERDREYFDQWLAGMK